MPTFRQKQRCPVYITSCLFLFLLVFMLIAYWSENFLSDGYNAQVVHGNLTRILLKAHAATQQNHRVNLSQLTESDIRTASQVEILDKIKKAHDTDVQQTKSHNPTESEVAVLNELKKAYDTDVQQTKSHKPTEREVAILNELKKAYGTDVQQPNSNIQAGHQVAILNELKRAYETNVQQSKNNIRTEQVEIRNDDRKAFDTVVQQTKSSIRTEPQIEISNDDKKANDAYINMAELAHQAESPATSSHKIEDKTEPHVTLPIKQARTTNYELNNWEDYVDAGKWGVTVDRGAVDSMNGSLDDIHFQGWLIDPLQEDVQEVVDREREFNQVDLTTDVDRMAPLPFLSNYRNPCWYEEVDTHDPYANSLYVQRRRARLPTLFYFDNQLRDSRGWRLRCLPYFMILGMPKCGTTDLFYRLIKHQHISGGIGKEPHWWTRVRYRDNATFTDYLDYFDRSAEVILRNISKTNPDFHPMVTGEGSASTLWDVRYVMDRNEGKEVIKTADPFTGEHKLNTLIIKQIHHVMPNVKFIVIFRNPTERLLSDFKYFHGDVNLTPAQFHQYAAYTIDLMNLCLSVNSTQYCAQKLPKRRDMKKTLCPKYPFVCWESDVMEYLRLNVGMYSVFLKNWLEVFPKEQFIFLTINEYSANRLAVLNQVAYFLGLDPYNDQAIAEISDMTHFNQNVNATLKMLPETERLLDDFYEPYNTELARIIGDTKFMFKRDQML